MKNDAQQRSIGDALAFLKAYGGDPALWSSAEERRPSPKVARRQKQIDRLAAETVREWTGPTIPR